MAPTTRPLLPLSGDKKAVKRTVAHFGSLLPSLSPTLVFPTPRKRPGRDSLHTEGWILREQLRATCVINTAISRGAGATLRTPSQQINEPTRPAK